MKKKISSFQYVASLIGVGLVTTTGSYLYFNHQYQINKAQTSQVKELAQVDELYEKIMKQYVGKVDQKKLIDGALKGMTEAIGDPYSVFLQGEDAKSLQDSLASSMEGIGATLTIVDEKVLIAKEPEEKTPAALAGLKEKDEITQVDGKKIAGMTLDKVVSLIRGKKGTTVNLMIKRENKTFPVTVKRDKVALLSVHGKLLENHVGLLQIDSFSEDTANEFQKEIIALRKQGATSLMVDLRQNPGGLLDQVIQMSSMVLKDNQTIVKWEDKEKHQFESKAKENLTKGFKVTEPLVVLVDSNSASAAEIFAGAVKDNKRGKVIGMNTYGKGTMQDVEGSKSQRLKLTTGRWFTPSGTSVDKVGLTPDIKVNYPKYASLPFLSEALTLKKGDHGPEVEVLKELLKAFDYQLDDSNLFDEKTENALKDYQQKNKIAVTGTWDKTTNQALTKNILEKLTKEDTFIEKGLEVLKVNEEK